MNITSKLKYIIALDFEATCEENQPKIPDRETEIIEFPAILMDLSTGEIKSVFHYYVRPVEQPILTSYCKSLTKITQFQVDEAEILPEILKKFDIWLLENEKKFNLIYPSGKNNVGSVLNCGFVTWTNFDINFFLESECSRKKIILPKYFYKWINLKGIFRGCFNIQNSKECTFEKALEMMKMNFNGNQHSGLDDAKNLARLTFHMMNRGFYLKWNGLLKPGKSILL